jgi:serine/threonine-protein kinase HipA
VTEELPDRAVVLLGDEEVGVLIRHEEHARFEPSEEWARRPAGERPVLGQQFEEDPYAAHVGRNRMGVPLWFEHLLPEVDGPLRKAVAGAVDLSPARGFPLLVLLGNDLPGNVVVRVPEEDISFRTVARRVRETRGEVEDDALPLRVSLAGVQFKISARLGKRGIAVPAWDEEGDWIVKFADQGHKELPQIEFWTMEWAREAGISVPQTRLEPTESIEGIEHLASIAGDFAFAIERYDRTPEGRVHQEDFAQIQGLRTGDGKYRDINIDSIVRLVAELAPEDVDELITRIVFCVVAGNDDAHAKNWSLWYPNPTQPRLSPAYDLVSTLVFPQYRDNPMALKIAGARRFEEVDAYLFRKLAKSAAIDEDRVSQVVEEAIPRQLGAWEVLREREGIPKEMKDFLDDRVRSLRLSRPA